MHHATQNQTEHNEEPTHTNKKASTSFAVDQLAEWIIAHCSNETEIQHLKELAKRFSFSLASAMDHVNDR